MLKMLSILSRWLYWVIEKCKAQESRDISVSFWYINFCITILQLDNLAGKCSTSSQAKFLLTYLPLFNLPSVKLWYHGLLVCFLHPFDKNCIYTSDGNHNKSLYFSPKIFDSSNNILIVSELLSGSIIYPCQCSVDFWKWYTWSEHFQNNWKVSLDSELWSNYFVSICTCHFTSKQKSVNIFYFVSIIVTHNDCPKAFLKAFLFSGSSLVSSIRWHIGDPAVFIAIYF